MIPQTKEERQLDFIISRLIEKGHISRNLCLANYISRLGSYICQLNKVKGWKIVGQYEPTANGKDYVYYALRKPKNA